MARNRAYLYNSFSIVGLAGFFGFAATEVITSCTGRKNDAILGMVALICGIACLFLEKLFDYLTIGPKDSFEEQQNITREEICACVDQGLVYQAAAAASSRPWPVFLNHKPVNLEEKVTELVKRHKKRAAFYLLLQIENVREMQKVASKALKATMDRRNTHVVGNHDLFLKLGTLFGAT